MLFTRRSLPAASWRVALMGALAVAAQPGRAAASDARDGGSAVMDAVPNGLPPDLNQAFVVGYHYLGEGEWAKAIVKFDEILAKKPDAGVALANRAFCLLQLGRMEEALVDVARAEAADRSVTELLEASVGNAFLARGLDRVEAHDAEGARANLNRATAYPTTRSRAYSELAYVDSMTNQIDACISHASLAIKADAQNPDPYSNRATCRARLGWTAEALADLDQAVSLDPGFATVRLSRAAIHARLKHCARALADAKEAARLDPSLAKLAEQAVSKCR